MMELSKSSLEKALKDEQCDHIQGPKYDRNTLR